MQYSTGAKPAPLLNQQSHTAEEDTLDNDPYNPPQLISMPRSEGAATSTRTKLAKARGDRALEMFESILGEQQQQQQQQQRQRQQAPADSQKPESSLQLYENAAKFLEMRFQPDVSTAQCFDYFMKHVYPEVKDGNHELRRAFGNTLATATGSLLSEVAAIKEKDYASHIATVSQIIKIRRSLGLFKRPGNIAQLVGGLVDSVYRLSTFPQDFPTLNAFQRTLNTQRGLLRDLVETWKIFSLPQHLVSKAETSPEFRLPPFDAESLQKYARTRNISLALATMFPRYAPRDLKDLTASLIASFALLTDPAKCTPAMQNSAKDFLDRLRQIFFVVPLERETLQRIFEENPGLKDYVLQRWTALIEPRTATLEGLEPSDADAAVHEGGVDTNLDAPRASTGPRPPPKAQDRYGSINAMLGDALASRDITTCENAWRAFWGVMEHPTPQRIKELQAREKMFDFFILVFATLRRPQRAVEVWNCMGKVQLKPSLKTYTSFMEGFKKSGNARGVQNVWEKLCASGLHLDTAAWTARISAMMHCGNPGAGLAALEEMRQIWEQSRRAPQAAGKGSSPLAVQPTIEPVNAAIAGLMRSREGLAAVGKLLEWAARHGIEPDIVTYNTLLGPLVREGNGDEAAKILAMMKKQNIEPDGATITIMLEDALDFDTTQSPEDRAQAVTRILSRLEGAGLKMNIVSYGKMIYTLLRQPGGNLAVDAVLSSIWKKGLELSPHICTMLAEHYFSKDPPDLAAVKRLVDNPRMNDRIFWERVVKGYAQADDAASALRYFKKIANSQSVTVSTLEELLHVLIRNQQLEEAAALVKKVKAETLSGKRGQQQDAESRFWKSRFWFLAQEHGLDEEPVGRGEEWKTAKPDN